MTALLDREGSVELLRAMVSTPSENPPGDEAAVVAMTADTCRDLGLDVEILEAEPGRGNVVARWIGGDGPVVAFCSHLDVVPAGDPKLWSNDPFGATVSGTKLYGRGSGDAKGPVAASLEAIAVLKKTGWEPSGSLELYLVSDEETMGFQGAGHLVETGAAKPDFVIVGEPTSLRVVRAQRGAYWFRVGTRGVAAHGSAPQNGVNAILHMAEILLHLEATLPDISHPVVGGPTISVGTIKGGEKTNIVPASCAVEIDRRSIPGETRADVTASLEAAVDKARGRFPDLDATVELMFESRPFEVAQDARIVVDVSEAVGESSGAPAELIGFRGASDARFFAEAGAEVVVCGPGDIGLAHTADEWIDLDEFHRGALAYARAFVLLDAAK